MLVINVLSEDVYEDCHIKDSINIPFDQLTEQLKDRAKDTEIVVYCASYMCPMSRRAWQLLHDKGFTNVRAYEGGAAEWYSLGYPTEGPAKKSYLQEQYDRPSGHDEIKTISAQELKEKLSL